MTISTSALPFKMIDGVFNHFTIFNVEADAANVATGLNAQYAREGLEGTEFVVSRRKDGKFLVTAIEHADEACWHVPSSMLLPVPEAPEPATVAFVVYEAQDGSAALCEGGVYSSAPQGEYAGNTIERAHADARTYNGRLSTSATGRYVVRSSLVGADCADVEVLSSLEDWQKALIPDVTPVMEFILDATGEVLATIGHSPTRGHVIAYQGREIETATMTAAYEWLMATGDTRPITMQAPRTLWAEAA